MKHIKVHNVGFGHLLTESKASDRREQQKATETFVGETITGARWVNGSVTLELKSGQEIFIYPGMRGVSDYDHDSISFWKRDPRER